MLHKSTSPDKLSIMGPPPKQQSAWKDLAGKLSCHGIPDWSQAKQTRERVVWAVIIGAFSALLVFELFLTIKEFYENPIVTTTSHKSARWINFPTVYICPAHKVDERKVDHPTAFRLHNVTHYEDKLAPEATTNMPDSTTATQSQSQEQTNYSPGDYDESGHNYYGPPPPPSYLDRKLTIWKKADGSSYSGGGIGGGGGGGRPAGPPAAEYNTTYNETWPTYPPPPTDEELYWMEYGDETVQELFMRVGLNTTEFLIECAFQSRKFKCEDRTTEIFDTSMGKCFLLDTNEGQSKQGIGLDVVIDNPGGSRPPPYDMKQSLEYGPYIRIDEHFDPLSNVRLLIPMNAQTRIGLTKKVIKLLNNKRSSTPQTCIETSKPLHVFNVTYSMDACQADCMQLEIVNQCNCLRPVDKRFINQEYKDYPTCSAETSISCVTELIENISATASQARKMDNPRKKVDHEDPIQKRYFKCVQECDRPCSYTVYRETVTHTQMIEDGVSMVEIAFDSMDYQLVIQRPAISPACFVSNLGGQLGIWLGASLMTILQLCIFLLGYLCQDNSNAVVRERSYSDESQESQSSRPDSAKQVPTHHTSIVEPAPYL